MGKGDLIRPLRRHLSKVAPLGGEGFWLQGRQKSGLNSFPSLCAVAVRPHQTTKDLNLFLP